MNLTIQKKKRQNSIFLKQSDLENSIIRCYWAPEVVTRTVMERADYLKYIDTLLFEPPTVDAEKGRNDGSIPSRFFIECLCGLVLR